MEKITIVSDGTSEGTSIFFDDELVTNVNSIEFKCHTEEVFADIKLGYVPYKKDKDITPEALAKAIEAGIQQRTKEIKKEV